MSQMRDAMSAVNSNQSNYILVLQIFMLLFE